MKIQNRDHGLTTQEVLIGMIIVGIFTLATVYAIKGVTERQKSITATMEVPKANTSAPVPAPWTGVNQDTWSMLYDTAVSANLDFTLWEGEGNAGQVLYTVSFTQIRIGSELNLLPCIPTHDGSWRDFLSHVKTSGYTVVINDEPVLDSEGHPRVHATMATVNLTATSRELAAQQATNLFRWLDGNPLSCA